VQISERNLPIDGDGHEGKYRSADRKYSDELADLAVQSAERPVTVQHVRVVKGDIQGRHHGVRNGQVHEKVVGHGPHPLVGQHNPYNDQISTRCHNNHTSEQQSPQHLSP